MKNLYKILFVLVFSTIAMDSIQSQQIRGFSEERAGIMKEVAVMDARTIHVRAYPKEQPQKKSLVVDDDALPVFKDYQIRRENGFVIIETPVLCVEYNQQTGNICFRQRKDNAVILSEKSSGFEAYEVLDDQAFHISQTFLLADNEAIYGLGQYQEGILNYRGQSVDLVHANREIANPVLLSTNNYLIYWDNYSKTIFKDNDTGATFWSEVGDGINYYFVYGEDMSDAITGFRDLTGHVPMLPKSAFGFWMSKERYQSFDELTSVVAEYRRRNIPLDNIVQDWQYWGKDRALWNSMEFHPENFNNPEEVIDKLHREYHVKLTLSVWPGVGPATSIYQAMDSAGVLFDVPTWAGYKVVDIYSPKAQQVFWNYLYRGLYTKGVDSWWLDATEPSFKEGQYQDKQEKWTKEAGMTAIGPFARYLNTYSLVLSQMMYNRMREISNKRVSVLTRSAFAGQQKYGTSTWSGDIYASWDVFKKQIPAGLNLCMTGIPYWTTDIGGFIVKNQDKGQASGLEAVITQKDGGYERGLEDPAYLELYTRWFQYAVFNPMFRAHGTDIPREIWHFGEPGTPYYDAQFQMIHLRYSLLSYIYSNAWKVTSRGETMMRALAMDFSDDTNVYNNADGFMFGDALLVYPVTRPMYFDREGEIKDKDLTETLYLPDHKGRYWYDLHTGKRYVGGQEVRYAAPLDIIPVFAKSGSIIPRNSPVEYVGNEDYKEMEIAVYTGADAVFTLYEDDNETYDYEKGLFSTIEMEWDDQRRKLIIHRRQGSYPGMIAEREFTIRVIEGKGKEVVKRIKYSGDEKVEVIIREQK